MKSSTVNISFNDDLLEKIDKVAREESRSRSELIREATNARWVQKLIYTDEIPDVRRSRRRTQTTRYERILVLQKLG